MRILGVIPARYASTRFPGKPLAIIQGKTMIQRVYEQALKAKSLKEVVVATDDKRIMEHVQSFGGRVLMTNVNHSSGTDRCNEVLQLLAVEDQVFDVVFNIQGDEPFINPDQIDKLAKAFDKKDIQIATLIKTISNLAELNNANVVKVVTQNTGKALYFSRYSIPFLRLRNLEEAIKNGLYFKHLGIYAYRAKILDEICTLPKSRLEEAESLEQLRWLENGFAIQTLITEFESFAIDTPEDLSKLTNNA